MNTPLSPDRTPDHIALARYAEPLGPAPRPNDADRAEAEAFFASYDADPAYKARNRDVILKGAARAAMQRRMAAEHRQAIAGKMLEAAE